VNPFGDIRGEFSTVYIFDLAKDTLFFSDSSQNQKLPLQAFRVLREEGVPTIDDFIPFEHPSIPKLKLLAFHPPYWTPSSQVSERTLTFVGRILSDFNFQWRHILRRTYADCTFRKLTRAVLDIATLDFTVWEEAEPYLPPKREYYISGNSFPTKEHHVSNNGYPAWEPYEKKLFTLGRIVVVLEQDLEYALALIPGDLARRNDSRKPEFGEKGGKMRDSIYLLFSLRHFMLCRVDHDNIPSYSRPIAFMNGIDTPSSASVTLILQALTFAFPPPPYTPIHGLPIELQDQVLEHVGSGRLDSARVGCALGLGSSFGWMRSKDLSRDQGPIERHVSYSYREETSPVEHEIYFGKIFSGVAYK
jgi:hypothetical protein